MEHAQRETYNALCEAHNLPCLNPYFNGTCSKRSDCDTVQVYAVNVLILILMEHAQRDIDSMKPMFYLRVCLNPYFNGTCSKSIAKVCVLLSSRAVLILILMEHAQREYGNPDITILSEYVLILILMEHAQRVGTTLYRYICTSHGLNPYFNGTCSKRMEKVNMKPIEVWRLNPYFNGTCSKRAFFVRPYVLICYVVKFTLINVFVLIKCTCFMQKIVQR